MWRDLKVEEVDWVLLMDGEERGVELRMGVTGVEEEGIDRWGGRGVGLDTIGEIMGERGVEGRGSKSWLKENNGTKTMEYNILTGRIVLPFLRIP